MTAGKDLLFSVVIPAYNRGKWVAEAVDSALSQDRHDFEVIVVDDGSTDNTEETLSVYKEMAVVIRQENAGVSVARNTGIENAQGEWVAFLDADDRWRPGHLGRLAEAIRKNPDAGLIYTDAMVIDDEGRELKEKRQPKMGDDPFIDLLLGNNITTSGAAVKRECFSDIGMFLPDLKSGQDCDVWLRVADKYPVIHLPEISVDYRRQPESTVHTRGMAMRDDCLFIMSRAASLRDDLPATMLKRANANCYYESAVRMLAASDARLARLELVSGLREYPSLKSLALLALSLGGPKMATFAVSIRRRNEGFMSSPVRVDYLITGTGTGGAEKILFELVTRLCPEKFSPRVISMKKIGRTGKKIQEAGVEVVSLGLPEKTDLKYVFFLLFAVVKLVLLIVSDRPKILHSWLFQANIAGRFAAKLCGVPINISGMRVIEEERMVQYPIDLLTSRMVTKYLAVCESVGNHYLKKLALPQKMMTVIPNGIDMKKYEKVSENTPDTVKDSENKTLIIGLMGRLHRQKGFDVFLRSFPFVVKKNYNIKALIAGGGPELRSLQNLIDKLNLEKYVQLLGEVSDPAGFMNGLDVFVLPSRWEGMPNVVLEAMAFGLPVIATNVGGSPELVVSGKDGETGIIVSPENEEELSSALISILDDPKRRGDMRESALSRVKKFDMEKMISQYEKLYEQLLLETF